MMTLSSSYSQQFRFFLIEKAQNSANPSIFRVHTCEQVGIIECRRRINVSILAKLISIPTQHAFAKYPKSTKNVEFPEFILFIRIRPTPTQQPIH